MQDEWSVAGNRIQPIFISGRPKGRRLFNRKIRVIAAGPLILRLLPPDQFLALAPRLARRARARSVIYNASIAGPGEPPPVAEIVFRIAGVGLVNFVRTENAGVNPTATRG